jgi:hypothetical protein
MSGLIPCALIFCCNSPSRLAAAMASASIRSAGFGVLTGARMPYQVAKWSLSNRGRYLDRIGHRLVGADRKRAQTAVLQERQDEGKRVERGWMAPLNISEMMLELTV